MTERLYYHDARQIAFDATVVEARDPASAGEGARVRLDRSAFYPASGGQPADKGMLAGAPVVDVLVEDGEVWHVLEHGAAMPDMGSVVHGEIDWARRLDMMQQHSGQHLLSQVFVRLFGWETLSVHMGEVESTLDLETASIEQAQIEAAEEEANRLIWQARPIRISFVDAEAIDSVPLRKPPKVTGSVRIVEIAEYDWSACGGTHCATTAEIAPMRIVNSERRRGGVRLTFLCGGRALQHMRQSDALLGAIASTFSADRSETPVLVERSLEKNKELQRRIDELTGRLIAADARDLLAASEEQGGGRTISILRDDLDANGVRLLATTLAAQPGVIALVGSVQEGKTLLAFARNAASTPDALHMGNLLRETLARAGGKGGGRPDFAQGGGVPATDAQELLAWARMQLAQARSRPTGC